MSETIKINDGFLDRHTSIDDLLRALIKQSAATNQLLQNGLMGGSYIDLPSVNISDESNDSQNLGQLVASILDVGFVKYKNKLYEVIYDATPYMEESLAKETALAVVKEIVIPAGIPALIVDFSSTTESTDGEDLYIGFNRTHGSFGFDTPLSNCHYGPYPLGSTGSIQVDTFKSFPIFLQPQEKVQVMALNQNAANSIAFGFTFHFIFLKEANIF